MNYKNIKPGSKYTRETLYSTFGVYGDYSYTRPHSDEESPAFLFSGIKGNTLITWLNKREFELTALLSSFLPFEEGLNVRDTEIREWVIVIKKNRRDYTYMGIAHLSDLEIINRKRDINNKWIIDCRISGELVDDIDYDDIQAVYEDADPLETKIIEPSSEGRRIVTYTTKYERSKKNREAAIRAHGTKCMVCGFDFEKVYGKLGKGFIEVHHVKPLYENEEETIPDPVTDLVCLCPNCHRMIHRPKNRVLTVEELREIISE